MSPIRCTGPTVVRPRPPPGATGRLTSQSHSYFPADTSSDTEAWSESSRSSQRPSLTRENSTASAAAASAAAATTANGARGPRFSLLTLFQALRSWSKPDGPVTAGAGAKPPRSQPRTRNPSNGSCVTRSSASNMATITVSTLSDDFEAEYVNISVRSPDSGAHSKRVSLGSRSGLEAASIEEIAGRALRKQPPRMPQVKDKALDKQRELQQNLDYWRRHRSGNSRSNSTFSSPERVENARRDTSTQISPGHCKRCQEERREAEARLDWSPSLPAQLQLARGNPRLAWRRLEGLADATAAPRAGDGGEGETGLTKRRRTTVALQRLSGSSAVRAPLLATAASRAPFSLSCETDDSSLPGSGGPTDLLLQDRCSVTQSMPEALDQLVRCSGSASGSWASSESPSDTESTQEGTIQESDDEYVVGNDLNESAVEAEYEFNIPYDDIKLCNRVKAGHKRQIFEGQWHGTVMVHTFRDLNHQESSKFWREVTKMTQTRHENIALFMGASMEPPRFAIVTSYCRGPSLYLRLHRACERMDHGFKLNVMRQIAQAVSYLHGKAKPIVVRKLNSKNIFLEPKVTLCLMDFSDDGCLLDTPDFVSVSEFTMYYTAPELFAAAETGQPGSEMLQAKARMRESALLSVRHRRQASQADSGVTVSLTTTGQTSASQSTSSGEATNQVTPPAPLLRPRTLQLGSAPGSTWSLAVAGTEPGSSQPTATLNATSAAAASRSSPISPLLLPAGTSPVGLLSSPDGEVSRQGSNLPSPSPCWTDDEAEADAHRLGFPILVAENHFSCETDMFAFGTLVFELFTHRFPLDSLPSHQLPQAIRAGKREPLDRLRISNILRNMIESCWHEKPRKRPEIGQVLQKVLSRQLYHHAQRRRTTSDPSNVGGIT